MPSPLQCGTTEPALCSDSTSIFVTHTDFCNIPSSKQGRFEDQTCVCRQGWAEVNPRGFHSVNTNNFISYLEPRSLNIKPFIICLGGAWHWQGQITCFSSKADELFWLLQTLALILLNP